MRVVNNINNKYELIKIVKMQEFKYKLNRNLKFIDKNISFSLLKIKLVELLGYDLNLVNLMENQYIKFLALIKTLWDLGVYLKFVPNKLIDEFWHNHILDTENYYYDCYKIFGRFLHHDPYYGLKNEEEKKEWETAVILSQNIWKETFYENLYGENNKNVCNCGLYIVSNCSSTCSIAPKPSNLQSY